MKPSTLWLLISFVFSITSENVAAQTPTKDTSAVKVYHLDNATVMLKDSLQKQNDTLKKQVQILKDIVNKSITQIESLEKEIGKSSEGITKSFLGINKKIDSLPQKITADNFSKNKEIIAVIPFYCSVQMFCIVKKNTTGLYDLILLKHDTIPALLSTINKDSLKYFTTGQRLDISNFQSWLKNSDDKKRPVCEEKTELLHALIQEKLDKEKEKETEEKNTKLLKDQRKEVDSLTQLLADFDRVAGEIKLNKKVWIYPRDSDGAENQKKKKSGNQLSESQNQLENFTGSGNSGEGKKSLGYMEIIKATLQIDNNKISDISFVADVFDNDGNLIRRLNTISNFKYSLSFSGLNRRQFTRKIGHNEYPDNLINNGFVFNYGDLINYEPRNNDFTPIVKNGNYKLSTDTTIRIDRRRYSDYLSFRTFLDPLGFLGNNPNGFAQLEGDANIPANLRNLRKYTFLPNVHINFSYIYNNTINSEMRIARALYLANDSFSVYNPITQTTITKTDSSNYIYNLDIARKAYYQAYTRLSIISREIKSSNSWIDAEIGFRILGAKVATQTDTSTYHKLIPEFNLKWTFRPDNLFGADINCGISFLGNTHRANNSPTAINNTSFLWSENFVSPHELNVYVLTGRESKGGLFFRYSGWWSFGTKLAKNIDERLLPSTSQVKKTGYFPQILFGYSTNLSTMIKRGGQER
jgi:hypothetical protein